MGAVSENAVSKGKIISMDGTFPEPAKDLWGKKHVQATERVRLYADEIKAYRNRQGPQWMYIGLLAIPESKYPSALGGLRQDRERANYPREVHFTELRNRSDAHAHNEKTLLAKRWAERVLYDDQKTFHFHLLGLNLDHLQNFAFGTGREQRRNMYNRFFRASVKGILKYYFGNQVVVTALFHDQTNFLEHDDLFDWHSIWRIQQEEPGITFEVDNILFINSDHEKKFDYPDDSHFIQLCDVLMGGLTQCLDARTKKDGCCEIAEILLPLAERLVDPRRAKNPNSRYHYAHRMSMSFFPSKALTQHQLEDPYYSAQSGFYIGRRLSFRDKQTGQLFLFD